MFFTARDPETVWSGSEPRHKCNAHSINLCFGNFRMSLPPPVLGAGAWMLDAGCWTLFTTCSSLHAGCRMTGAGYPMLNAALHGEKAYRGVFLFWHAHFSQGKQTTLRFGKHLAGSSSRSMPDAPARKPDAPARSSPEQKRNTSWAGRPQDVPKCHGTTIKTRVRRTRAKQNY